MVVGGLSFYFMYWLLRHLSVSNLHILLCYVGTGILGMPFVFGQPLPIRFYHQGALEALKGGGRQRTSCVCLLFFCAIPTMIHYPSSSFQSQFVVFTHTWNQLCCTLSKMLVSDIPYPIFTGLNPFPQDSSCKVCVV